MQDTSKQEAIIEKMTSGMQFGLFENGTKCYFQDGEKVSYADLWKALRVLHHLEEGKHYKTLKQLCPDSFVGIFAYKFSKHKWEEKQVMK